MKSIQKEIDKTDKRKKNIKNKNNPNKKNIPEQLDYTFKEEEIKENMVVNTKLK